MPYGAVFNFELDPPAMVAVSGVQLVTLGQDLRLQPYVGVTEESNELFGWGWRRQRGRRAQLLRQARRMLQEEDGRRGGTIRGATRAPEQGARRKLNPQRHGMGGCGAVPAATKHGSRVWRTVLGLLGPSSGVTKHHREVAVEVAVSEVALTIMT